MTKKFNKSQEDWKKFKDHYYSNCTCIYQTYGNNVLIEKWAVEQFNETIIIMVELFPDDLGFQIFTLKESFT